VTPSKQRILERIRQAARERTPKPYPDIKDASAVFPQLQDDLAVVFARSFVQAGGFFHYAESPEELAERMRALCESKGWNHLYCWDKHLQDLLIDADFRYVRIGRNLDKADGAITDCEALLARTGSVLLSSKQAAGRTLSAFPHVHLIIATPDELVEDIRHGFELLENKYGGSAQLPSMICVATGPSRTADIEKTLVLGAHGPKEIHVFLYDHRPEEADGEE
jgi:L-lactate dehydrogenase complex protein LldG